MNFASTSAHPCTRSARSAHAGFTLLELLIVVSVVTFLVALLVVVATGALGNQRVRQSEATLRTLERALDEYELARGVYPPLVVDDGSTDTFVEAHVRLFDPAASWNTGNEIYSRTDRDMSMTATGGDLGFSGSDAMNRYPLMPTSWFFLEFTLGYGDVEALLADLPSSAYISDVLDAGAVNSISPLNSDVDRFSIRRQLVDAWGNPILFVQTGNSAAEGLFGRALNDRPYFLSAGLDERYGVGPEVTATAGGSAANQEVELIGFTEDNLTSAPTGPTQAGGSFQTNVRLRGAF